MKLPAQPNQSLIDGLAILQDVAARDSAVGSRELARDLDIEPTRVNRLLKTLSHLGLAQQDEQRKYRAGSGIHVLAAQALFGSGLIRRAVPHLEALHSHGLIVAMGVLWRDQVSYLYHATAGMDASVALGRVGLFPAQKSAIGLALLAKNCDLRKCNNKLKVEIKKTRELGFAKTFQNQKEHQEPSSTKHISLGVALPDDSATAIALSGLIEECDIPKLTNALKHTAKQIAETNY